MSKSNNVPLNHAPSGFGGVDVNVEGFVDVNTPLVGKSIIDGLWGKFSTSSQLQQGDFLMDRSRNLLRRHLHLIEVNDQDTIRKKIDDVRDVRNSLESSSGSRIQRLREARKYRQRAKVAFRIIQRASERGIEDRLMDQITQEIQRHVGGSGSGFGTASTSRNPFTDSHAASSLTDVSVIDLDRVEMSTFQDEDSGEAAVVLDLVARDRSVQHIVGTYSTEAFSGDGADRGGEMPTSRLASQSIVPEDTALSLYREDGTMVRFIAASPPDVSRHKRGNEGEGKRSLDSVISDRVMTSDRADLPY